MQTLLLSQPIEMDMTMKVAVIFLPFYSYLFKCKENDSDFFFSFDEREFAKGAWGGVDISIETWWIS